MKTYKTIIVLAMILVGLLAARFGQQWLLNKPEETPAYASFWNTVRPIDIVAFRITQADSNLSFAKQSNQAWKVNEYEADAAKIDDMLVKLIAPNKVEIVSENPDRHESLGISSSSAVLSMETNNGVKSVSFGKATTGGSYIKLEGNDSVFLISEIPTGIEIADLSNWVDAVIARIDQQSISKLTITNSNSQMIINKDDSKWMMEGQEVNMTAINPLLMTLESFTTQGLIDQQDLAQLPKVPVTTVKVEQAGQESILLNFIKLEEAAAVTIDKKPGVFGISLESLNNFQPNAKELVTKTPLSN